MQVRRLGYAVMSTPDLPRQIDYYTQVIGLQVVARDSRRAVLATSHGIETLVLQAGGAAALTGLAFQISPCSDLRQVCMALERAGVKAVERAGEMPGCDRVLAFQDPHGTEIELFTTLSFFPAAVQEIGILPLKLGHVAVISRDVAATTSFYGTILGFRRSDWRSDVTVFMRCNSDHHTCNFFFGEQPGLHHLAFEVKDWAELSRAADFLARQRVALEWGPGRHIIGHNVACYHFNPDGVRIELYAEMDQMTDEELGFFEPRPWHEDRPQRPRDWPLTTPRSYWSPSAL